MNKAKERLDRLFEDVHEIVLEDLRVLNTEDARLQKWRYTVNVILLYVVDTISEQKKIINR